ncbi:MAG: folylpolyglutamate synthase/dihydrofolate synthase family protein [Crocinitomicaceae bacterium]|nr:folylpolyglutamate synthase/dihydrofolate synthase family protein [Crocinitomicaceae bacterium]
MSYSYEEATDWLFQQFPSYQTIGAKAFKPTLDNTLKIVELLGNPQSNLKFIHVAGSNGKGSTSSMLASILTSSGYTVGLFTSPHIKDYRERIRINGECIPEKDVVDFVKAIKLADLDFEPSFFEITLGLALQHFENNSVDICIIETGLGGRLDATNIINPLISVITNISLEHTAMLGDTLELIAQEKAGIIKPYRPVVLGNIKTEILPVFEKIADQNNATLHTSMDVNTDLFELPLLGDYQQENFKTVLKTLELLAQRGFSSSPFSIQEGLEKLSINTGFRGRLQKMDDSPTLIYDVSHNPDGIRASFESILKINSGQLHIIYGTSNDKDVQSILGEFPENANYYFTEFTNERSIQITDLKQLTSNLKSRSREYFTEAEKALKAAKLKAKEEDTILVIGSFFLISDFF